MLLELLGAAGITLILVRGGIFAWARRNVLRPLLTCAMCTGWWVGVVARGAMFHQDWAHVGRALVVDVLLFAGAVSLLSALADFSLACLDSHTKGEP